MSRHSQLPLRARQAGVHRIAARVRGVSLIELMVALVLGLIVTGSALTLFMTNRQTFAATETLGRVQENARVAFELMVRDIRQAGGNPCDSNLPVASNLTGSNWWNNLGPAVSVLGYDGTTEFTDAGAAAFGTGEGQRVAGTAAIELKSAVGLPGASIMTADLTDLSSDVTVSSVAGLRAGDALVLCNYYQSSVFQASGLGGSGTARTVSHTDDIETDPGVLVLFPPPYSPSDPDPRYKTGSVLSRLQATRWYIGCNGRANCDPAVEPGGRSLFRASLVNNSGVLGEAVDEIAEGVSDMDLRYLVTGASDYQSAAAGTAWANVEAVRVELTLEGQDQIDEQTLERRLQHTVAIRSRNP